MIPILEIDRQGNISTLYNDEVDLFSLGIVYNVHRATLTEFNETRQWWEVINANTKEIVYQNKIRERCIEWEIINFGCGGKYYNEQ